MSDRPCITKLGHSMLSSSCLSHLLHGRPVLQRLSTRFLITLHCPVQWFASLHSREHTVMSLVQLPTHVSTPKQKGGGQRKGAGEGGRAKERRGGRGALRGWRREEVHKGRGGGRGGVCGGRQGWRLVEGEGCGGGRKGNVRGGEGASPGSISGWHQLHNVARGQSTLCRPSLAAMCKAVMPCTKHIC